MLSLPRSLFLCSSLLLTPLLSSCSSAPLNALSGTPGTIPGVRSALLAPGFHGRLTQRTMQPRYITIHSTANRGGTAAQHARLLLGSGLRSKNGPRFGRSGWVNWHFTVDDREAVQHLLPTEEGDHADYGGLGDTASIGIEICEFSSASKQAAAIDRAARLAATLAEKYGIPTENIVPHKHWPRWDYTYGKPCPRILLERGSGPGGVGGRCEMAQLHRESGEVPLTVTRFDEILGRPARVYLFCMMNGKLSLFRFLLVCVIAGTVAIFSSCRPRTEVLPRVEFTLQKVAFLIGDTKIYVQVSEVGRNPLTMIHLHEDEQTSAEAGRIVLEKYGGRLIQLVHSGNRRVTFTLDGNRYSFDPNRIFSDIGVRKTLRGPTPVPEKAYAAVNQFAVQFERYFGLRKQRSLIALHNNGAGFLSIHSYEPGSEFSAEAEEVYINPDADPDDFYYVTDDRFFSRLAERKFNVVLQNNQVPADDGSLSVFAGRHHIPYINVEAQNGHLTEQLRMLESAVHLISGDFEKDVKGRKEMRRVEEGNYRAPSAFSFEAVTDCCGAVFLSL